jgi:hypothetical protein
MPLFLIERHFAEQLDVSRDRSAITRVSADIGS